MKINEIFYPSLLNESRYLILYGSAGSGKSVFASQKIVTRVLTEKGHRILILRKVARTLRESCFALIKATINDDNLGNEFNMRETDMHITCLRNGNEILFAGLDDVEKLKSIVTPTSIWCEEPTEFTENDFSQVELRMRGETQNYKQFILSFNPIDEDHWIKKRFFDIADDQVKAIHANYKTNAFLDADYVRHLEERLKHNENLYRIYVLGEWGKVIYGGEFYKCFRSSKHIKFNQVLNGVTAFYNKDLPLHISFDFNVNPYMTCTIWQIDGLNAVQIDELCLSNPNNTTVAICREFTRRYKHHEAGLFIYGDPSGKHEDTRVEKRTEDGYNDFTIIRNELESFNPSMRISSSAPPVVARGNFINAIFENNFEGINITIGNNCKNSCRDYQYLQEASDGRKSKEKEKNENSGIQHEKYGHTSDASDYLLCYVYRSEFTLHQKGNKLPTILVGERRPNYAKSY